MIARRAAKASWVETCQGEQREFASSQASQVLDSRLNDRPFIDSTNVPMQFPIIHFPAAPSPIRIPHPFPSQDLIDQFKRLVRGSVHVDGRGSVLSQSLNQSLTKPEVWVEGVRLMQIAACGFEPEARGINITSTTL